MARLRARYVGYTNGTENHGDEALMWIIEQLLAPDFEVVYETDVYDVAFLGGGTLINQSPWLIEHFQGILDKAPLGGFVFGTGVGDPTFWGHHFGAWRMLLDRCDFVGVRGPRSMELLKNAGVSHAEVIGDPYLALRSPLSRPPQPRLLGVNFGTTNGSLWGEDENGYLEFLFEVLSDLKERGWDFLFVSVWSKDLPIVQAMKDRLGVNFPVLDARTDGLEALCRLSSCDLFMGEKLHANAMAAVAEVPFLALEYQPKVRDFAQSLEMQDYVLSTAVRDPQVVVAMLEEMHNRRELIRARLTAALAAHRANIADFSRRIRRHYLNRTVAP